MSEPSQNSLETRVAQLENEVIELKQNNQRISQALAQAGIQLPFQNNAGYNAAPPSTYNVAPPQSGPMPYNPNFAPPQFYPNYAQPQSYAAYTPQPQPGPVYNSPTQQQPYPPSYQYPIYPQPNPVPQKPRFDLVRDSQFWLNKIGIGLLLLGVAFLVGYSIDQGWLSHWAQIGLGMFIGLVLLGVAQLTYKNNRAFSQVLMGGSIGAFYITGYAAFEIYQLVSYPVGFGFMVLVTLFAFGLSLWQNEVILALIGVAGGLATPFLLTSGSSSLNGLVIYTSLLLALTSAIYFYRGWRSLLWLSFVGGWLVLIAGYKTADSLAYPAKLGLDDKFAIQAGIIFAGLVFGLVPVIRQILASRNPSRWAEPPIAEYTPQLQDLNKQHLNGLIFLTALIAPVFSAGVWSFNQKESGVLALGVMLLYGGIAVGLQFFDKKQAFPHATVAVVALTVALLLLLQGDVLLVALAVEAAALQVLAFRTNNQLILLAAIGLFTGLGLWFPSRLTRWEDTTPFISSVALANLIAIALLFFSSRFVRSKDLRNLYWFAAHIGLLSWLYREFSIMSPQEGGYITVAWGIYAVILLGAGLRLDSKMLLRFGMATLLLVIAKLLLVDVSQLQIIWRILLFLGFGSLLLVLSYFFQDLWKARPEPSEPTK